MHGEFMKTYISMLFEASKVVPLAGSNSFSEINFLIDALDFANGIRNSLIRVNMEKSCLLITKIAGRRKKFSLLKSLPLVKVQLRKMHARIRSFFSLWKVRVILGCNSTNFNTIRKTSAFSLVCIINSPFTIYCLHEFAVF